MSKEILKIYTDNEGTTPDASFHDIEIDSYSFNTTRMGMPTLTATIKYGQCLDDDWSGREYITLRGGRYYIKNTPKSSKNNADARYSHEITFVSERDKLLGNVYMYDTVYNYASTKDKPCSNSTKVLFYGTVVEFIDRFNCALLYAGVGDSILKIKTNLTTDDTPVGDGYCAMFDIHGPYGVSDLESKEFSCEDAYLWDAITSAYNLYEIPFVMRGRTFVWGASDSALPYIFKYGHDSALLSITKNNANAKVINKITMIGSSENIPYYYPNPTEYGHIRLKAAAANNVLTADMFTIEQRTLLLSRVSASDKIILGRYVGSIINPSSYFTCFGDNDYALYELGTGLYNSSPAPTANTKIRWHLRLYFTITTPATYVLQQINGTVWQANSSTTPDSGREIVAGAIAEGLYKVGSTVNLQDEADKVTLTESGISLNNMAAGSYYLQLYIDTPPFSYCVLYSALFVNPALPYSRYNSFYWQVGEKRYDKIGELGLSFNGTLTKEMIGDSLYWEAYDRIPFQTTLMPSKYRETAGDDRFYEAKNDTYPKPSGGYYYFPNPYQQGEPNEYIYKDDKIKPTIDGVRNDIVRPGGTEYQLLGEIADIAYDSDDSDSLIADTSEESDKNDSTKYAHPYFYIKLNVFSGQYGFDLFKHASQTDAMTLQMTSGNCNGCKFKIQAIKKEDSSGLYIYTNPVRVKSENGDIVDGTYTDKVKDDNEQSFQQNTMHNSIWICVQKDAETFGVIVPNNERNYKPAKGDTFNIINIDLPDEYLYAAEDKLENEGLKYMSENNEEKFTFDLTLSRIFLAEHPEILNSLDEYSKIKIEYNGKIYEQFVSTFTMNCNSDEPLPEVQIGLVDKVAVGESFAESIVNNAIDVIGGIPQNDASGSGYNYDTILKMLMSEFLSKRQSDRSQYKIASDYAFEVGKFVSGSSGGIFMYDAETGKTFIEVDELRVRLKAIFESLEIAHTQSIGGEQIITPGGSMTISYVETADNGYKCYFKGKEDNKGAECRFMVNDFAICKEFNIQAGIHDNASNRYYWRKVIEVNNDMSYIVLSKGIYDHVSSDVPQAGDVICQLGNDRDTSRQSAIILSTTASYAPCVTLYSNIRSFNLDNKVAIQYGVAIKNNIHTPFLNCYGDFYFGDINGDSYFEYISSENKLLYRGELSLQSTIGGKAMPQYILATVDTDYKYLTDSLLNAAKEATDIYGGLVLSTMIKLGYTSTDGKRVIMAGMNGAIAEEQGLRTLASWWGGDMIDRFTVNDELIPNIAANAAAAAVRFDGSGYFAKGAIGWRQDGSGWLAGNNITWNKNGKMTFGSGIEINLSDGDTGLSETLESVLNITNGLGNLFEVVDSNGNKLDDFQSANIFAIKATKGFFSDEFISVRGASESSDERLKTVITDFYPSLDEIANAPSVFFEWKDNKQKDVGSIAQYWQKIAPELVPERADGVLGLNYGKAAMSSVVSLAREVRRLKHEVETLKKQLM